MTDALCLKCGAIKFGALCPCAECGTDATGNARLDILFCDHQLSRESLEQLGAVIKVIQPLASNPEVGFWAFIVYVSRNHPSLLKADAPPQIAAAVDALLARCQFPAVTLSPGRERSDDAKLPPLAELPLPATWVAAFKATYPFQYVARVELRKRDGSRATARLVQPDDVAVLLVDPKSGLTLASISAIREARGCFLSFRRRPWVELDAPPPPPR